VRRVAEPIPLQLKRATECERATDRALMATRRASMQPCKSGASAPR